VRSRIGFCGAIGSIFIFPNDFAVLVRRFPQNITSIGSEIGSGAKLPPQG
jgi:hypothetical protein